MVVLGLLLLGWAGWIYLTDENPTTIKDDTRCAVCGKELPAGAQSTGECPYCLLKKVGPKKGGNADQPRQYLVAAVLIGLFLLLVGTHLVIFLCSRSREGSQEEAFCHFHCPQCKRKLRYPVRQSGQVGRCPTCRKQFLFPLSA